MYLALDQLNAYIQEQLLAQGLDDSNSGTADTALFATIQVAVEREVHSYLEGRYSVPFTSNVPNLVTHACLVLSAEAVWLRRGNSGDANPFSKAAETIRQMLADVRKGDINLSRDQAPDRDPGVLISEESLIAGSGRLTL
jgi:phage gp36-like protein